MTTMSARLGASNFSLEKGLVTLDNLRIPGALGVLMEDLQGQKLQIVHPHPRSAGEPNSQKRIVV